MELFANTQANGVLSIDMIANHGDFLAILTDGNLMNGGTSVLNNMTVAAPAPQLVDIHNGDVPFPPPINK